MFILDGVDFDLAMCWSQEGRQDRRPKRAQELPRAAKTPPHVVVLGRFDIVLVRLGVQFVDSMHRFHLLTRFVDSIR